jgi:glycosyltransferase involved in cell wall biosynthesis
MKPASDGAPSAPEVSIGMPVFNGERFLREALDSLLSQTFADFELIISDNASTDASEQICREYVRSDPRVRYIRQPRNMGAMYNWNFVVGEARGRFFKWASCNDRCEPTMLEKCVEVLRQDQNVVLCYGRTWFVDDDGSSLGACDSDPEILDPRPSQRLERLRDELHFNNAMCGLIRLDRLKETRLNPPYAAGDMVLMTELALRGGYRLLPDVLFFRRRGKKSASNMLSKQELAAFLNPVGNPLLMGSWRRHKDYLSSVLHAPIGFREKAIAFAYTLRRVYWHRGDLWRDLRSLVHRGRRQSSTQNT